MATTLSDSNTEYIPKEWESVHCIFCSHDNFFVLEKFGPSKRYQYVRCRKCNLAYLNPRPKYDDQFIETAYSVYTDSVREVWDGNGLTAKGQKVHNLNRFVLNQIEDLLGRKGSMLEIGCSIGFFSKTAVDVGWDVVGIDISPTTVELAKKEFKINALCGDWTKIHPNKKFDAIYCSHTIEHIPNPKDWLNEMKKTVAEDGIICIEVPNMESVDRKIKRLLKTLGVKKDNWAKWRTPDHLYEPCEKSFVPYLEKCGFEVIHIQTYSRSKSETNFWSKFYNYKLRLGSNLRLFLRVKN